MVYFSSNNVPSSTTSESYLGILIKLYLSLRTLVTNMSPLVVPSTPHSDTPSDSSSLQPSYIPSFYEYATPSIVLLDRPSLKGLDIPIRITSEF